MNVKRCLAGVLVVSLFVVSCLTLPADAYAVGAYMSYNKDWQGNISNVDFSKGVWGEWFYTSDFFMSASPSEFYIGDLDLDGYVTTLDLDILYDSLSYSTNSLPWYNCVRDMDQNGTVNKYDYYYLRNYLWQGGETNTSFSVVGCAGRHMSEYKRYHFASDRMKKAGKCNGYVMQYRMDWRAVNGTYYARTKYYINGSSSSRNKWRVYMGD